MGTACTLLSCTRPVCSAASDHDSMMGAACRSLMRARKICTPDVRVRGPVRAGDSNRPARRIPVLFRSMVTGKTSRWIEVSLEFGSPLVSAVVKDASSAGVNLKELFGDDTSLGKVARHVDVCAHATAATCACRVRC